MPPWRLLPLFLILLAPCTAWDTAPHQVITRAALGTLPRPLVDRFKGETAALIDIYCIYPDRYLEMERYGFVRKSPGPRTAAEIRPYCLRPDGQPIHGASGDSREDLATLRFLFERIAANLSAERADEAAKYAGVLSHFIADSLSPPHAVTPERLREMMPDWAAPGVQVHSILEKSIPAFTLAGRRPPAASSIREAAGIALEECYAGRAANRKDLRAMVEAACSHDENKLDQYRRRAGVRAAEILADALYSIARSSEPRP